MLVRDFLVWSQKVDAAERVKATREFVESYLTGEIQENNTHDVLNLFMVLAEDKSQSVRLALAESLAHSEKAPYPVIAQLIQQSIDVASLVLSYSPLLNDLDLIEIIRTRGEAYHTTILARPEISPKIALALAQHGSRNIIDTLLDLPELESYSEIVDTIIERFGEDAHLRTKVNESFSLSAENRFTLIQKQTADLSQLLSDFGWLSKERSDRLFKDVGDKAILMMTADLDENTLISYVKSLISKNALTASLLLRALFSNNKRFFDYALAELSSLDVKRVQGLTRDFTGKGVKVLLKEASIAEELAPIFESALNIRFNSIIVTQIDDVSVLNFNHIEQTFNSLRQNPEVSTGCFMLLRRFEQEAAKEQAESFKNMHIVIEHETSIIPEVNVGEMGWAEDAAFVEENPILELTEQASAIELFEIELNRKQAARAAAKKIVEPVPLIETAQDEKEEDLQELTDDLEEVWKELASQMKKSMPSMEELLIEPNSRESSVRKAA